MKLQSLTLGLATAAAIFMTGCGSTYSEESLGLRNTNLYTETSDTTGDQTMYATTAAGESKKIDRAFENAPPMIPHSIDGMLPITINNNSCTSCHEPAIAESMGATPIPKSHFTDFRPKTGIAKNGQIEKDGKAVDNTSDFKVGSKSLSKLSGSRFNCSQCHAPQSTGKLVIESEFKSEFRDSNDKGSSNLVDVINEGIE